MIPILYILLFSLPLLSASDFSQKDDSEKISRPHIIFIFADDLGWNDVSFHGMSQIPTPNIDALAFNGVMLHRYYVMPMCSPSRSALMTGKYPIHNGMQHWILDAAEPRGLPLEDKILPEYLKDLGYITRIVGKWHLGFWKKEYTPTYRGFDSHLGYWTGYHDYFDHTAVELDKWGLDIRRNMEVAYDTHGKYSTDLFTDEAVRLIQNHDATNTSAPLYLYLAHAAVHSSNPYSILPAPDDVVAKFGNITDYYRRKFAAILTKLDDSVGRVVQALQQAGMLNDSIIIFSSDNGGSPGERKLNAASNWPLRGIKNTLWEGGVRGAGAIWSSRIIKKKRVANQMMHITDWLPTLYSAAGGNIEDLGDIDGVDLWPTLSKDTDSNRTEILLNIDDIDERAGLIVGDWKIVKGTVYSGAWDDWYGPSGRDVPIDPNVVINSATGSALNSIGYGLDANTIIKLRNENEVRCSAPWPDVTSACKPITDYCLFNLKEDPCEQNNLAEKYPTILKYLVTRLEDYNETAVPPGNLNKSEKGDPKYWNNVWTNFGDFI